MSRLRIFRKSVWYLIGATRGGVMRARIMHALLERPLNANKLAEALGIDYKTARHHIDVLKKNNWITGSTDKYGGLFFPTFTDEEIKVFEEIWREIGQKF
jgi:DNA-binding transcriptional ArsR family regulator